MFQKIDVRERALATSHKDIQPTDLSAFPGTSDVSGVSLHEHALHNAVATLHRAEGVVDGSADVHIPTFVELDLHRVEAEPVLQKSFRDLGRAEVMVHILTQIH